MSPISFNSPLTLEIESSSDDNFIRCEQLLRELPDKRLVYRGTWRQRAVIVKMFLDGNSARRHCSREKSGIEALGIAGIPTPELLFSGKSTNGAPVLVLDFIHDAQTALEVWTKSASTKSKVRVLLQLVEVVVALHDKGLVQADLHLENFLVAGQKIYAIDGDTISCDNNGKPLDLNASSRNLALLFAQLPPAYDSLIEPASKHYARLRGLPDTQFLGQLKLDLPKIRRRRRHKYLQKCSRTCSEFIRSKSAGQVAVFRRDSHGEALKRLLDDPDAFIRDGTYLKDGKTSTVVRVQADDYDWVVKRYNIKSLGHAFMRCFRPTRAWTSWRNYHRLKISGIAAPRAVAVVEKRIGPLRSTGYYVYDFIDGLNAKDVFPNDAVPDTVKELLAEKFVRLFSLFNKLKFRHGDCKAANFLFKDNELWVLDLDSMREYSSPVRFNRLFQKDRQRFLQNWQEQPELQRWFDEHLPE